MGALYLVTLPIGNLGDITERGRAELSRINQFAVEDTRSFLSVLSLLGIEKNEKRILSFHDHSEENRINQILSMLQNGDVAICSDAGSPIISDPAFPLVKKAISEGIRVESVPGVTAPIVALELSGLPPSPFHFHGFSGRERKDRVEFFKSQAGVIGTHLYFESPHRILDSIDDMAKTLSSDVEFVIARELTKKHESFHRLKLGDWAIERDKVMVKGEFVVLFHIAKVVNEHQIDTDELKVLSLSILESGANPKRVAKLVAQVLGRNSSDVYAEIIKNR